MKTYYALFIVFIAILLAGIFITTLPVQILNMFWVPSEYAYIFRAAIIIIFGVMALHLLSASIVDYGRNRPRMDERSIANLVKLLGYGIIVLLLLSSFNVNITGVLIGAGFLGIVIGLASQATLGNLFAGISMMAAKPFAEGDRITFSTWQYGMLPPSFTHNQLLPGYSGTIMVLGLMYTKIKLDEGTVIFVPNGVLNQAVIINYTVSDIMEIKIRVELGSKVQFDAFKKRILEGVGKNNKLAKLVGDTVEVKVTDIGISNYGVTISVSARIENEKFVQSELAAIALKLATSATKP